MKRLNWLGLPLGWVLLFSLAAQANAQPQKSPALADVHARILQLEDARSLGDGALEALLHYPVPSVRQRAALALGRIGDKRATPALLKVLAATRLPKQRAMVVFALGEMEDVATAQTLQDVLAKKTESLEVRARAAEALGKIANSSANVTALGPERLGSLNHALLTHLPAPTAVLTPGAKLSASLTITALMRLKQSASVEPLARQLSARDAAIRGAAANALFRLGQPLAAVAPALVKALADRDADVRANTARALGLSKTPQAFALLIKLLSDPNERVQVSAVRGLVALADARAAEPLVNFGVRVLERYEQAKAGGTRHPAEINTLLEIVAALGGFNDEACAPFFHRLRTSVGAGAYTEIEAALRGLGEKEFWYGLDETTLALGEGPKAANLVQALGELATERAKAALLRICEQAEEGKLAPRTIGELLRALSRAKLACPPGLARRQLRSPDPSVRAQAATLLTEQTTENFSALTQAYAQSGGNTMNAARLALLNAIAKFQSPPAVSLVKAAVSDADLRVRRRAVELLKQWGEQGGELPVASGAAVAAPPHEPAYYTRLLALESKTVTVTLYTSQGPIQIELFAREAPMTVDNFIELARRGYFNGSPFHRVVPNFVAQGGGDPRNEGGPGYQIRCEINQRLYQRGTLGMALAGKDTGSSQFFFCHAPQPHLDGSYTIFGQVLKGMEIVDRLTRDDVIERVEINER